MLAPFAAELCHYNKVKLVPKTKLEVPLKNEMDNEVRKLEHKDDKGPIQNWFTDNCAEHLLVMVIDDNLPIGIIYFGGTNSATDVGWWIISRYRGKKYGNKAIDELAVFLKGRGVTAIGRISVDTYLGKYDEASCELVKRLKKHFI